MSRITGLALVLILVASALSGCGKSYEFKGTAYPANREAADFELMASSGDLYRLSDHQDKVHLLFFGYTSCPDVCPTSLSEARQVLEGLGDDAEQVQVLFITVDPERDSVTKLANYTAAFHPAILGLTGDQDELAVVRDEYGIIAEKKIFSESALGYLVNHTARMFLVDQEGNLSYSYRFKTPAEDILSDVQHLIES
ncbi:MAG: SCO family protein [Chloroflexota bacterium]|nr:SCO family protein [Chloroflexota bacterium]